MAEEIQTETEIQAPPEEIERKARDLGWQPKDVWKGNPDAWVDAGEFVKRGETFVPFLQHDRRRLKDELNARDQRIARLEADLRATHESVEGLRTFNEGMAKERNERRKAEIGQELRVAREAGDDVRVAELQNELGEVVKPPPKVETKQPGNGTAQPQIQPWVKNFIEGNKDFFESPRKVALFNAVMLERRQAGDGRVGETEGTALLNEAREEVEKVLGGNARRAAPPRSEESRTTGNEGGNRRGNGKSFNDLPQDARDKCDAQESRFVGKTKAFKDQAAWRKHFTNEYFGPSAIAMRSTGE